MTDRGFAMPQLARITFVAAILALGATVAVADQTKTLRPDGGTVVTVTTRNGTECTLYSKQGVAMCTRTFNISDHKAAIARCMALKC